MRRLGIGAAIALGHSRDNALRCEEALDGERRMLGGLCDLRAADNGKRPAGAGLARIRADLEALERGLQITKTIGDHALAKLAGHGEDGLLWTARQVAVEGLKHGLKNRWDASEHKDTVQMKARGAGNRVLDQLSAIRDAGHTPPRGRELFATRLIALRQNSERIVAFTDRHTERFGNALGRDVIMGRTNPARGEHHVSTGFKITDSSDDTVLLIRNNANFDQREPAGVQCFGKVMRIAVLGAAREELITNQKARCGGDGLRHPRGIDGSAPVGKPPISRGGLRRFGKPPTRPKMQFDPPLQDAVLLRRYKRFLADIRWPDGQEETVHCPNPGAMLGVAPEGARCWVSRSKNKARKLPCTLEVVECEGPDGLTPVGVNTNHPNRLAEEAILAGLVEGIDPALPLEREVRYGEERSRIDLLQRGEPSVFIEVKNCHLLRREDGVTEFPDCVTARGLKHLRELARMVDEGHRAVLLFIVQRSDGQGVATAADLDPAYAEGFAWAAGQGVEMRAVGCSVEPSAIIPQAPLPILL